MDEKQKKSKIIAAYDDELKKSAQIAKEEIANQIEIFLEWLKSELNDKQKLFDVIEERIKSKDSFIEKIERKGYILDWDIKEDIGLNRKVIMENLPDLIGFRINCYFLDDEIIIYDKLNEYYKSNKFESIILDFEENTECKNGHKIYKVSGKYKNKINFEIQIKSIINNFWGEVEHRTIYKNRIYDSNRIKNQQITCDIYDVLKAII